MTGTGSPALDEIRSGGRGVVGLMTRLTRRRRGEDEPSEGVSRRNVLLGATMVGTAMTVDPWGYLTRPTTAYAAVCGPGASAGSGWTVFCCTVNKGSNSCPPGSFAAGWWKAADSSWCCGGYRYIIDCNATCRCGCRGTHMCNKGCWSCGCSRGSSKTCDQRRHCCNAFRYGQCNTQVRCSGGVVCRIASCVPPYEFENCTRTTLRDDRTAQHNAPCLQGCGPILKKYLALGGEKSVLRHSLGPQRSVGDGKGTYVHYAGGAIYSSTRTGTRMLSAGALTAYLGAGGPRGPLGYPTQDSTTVRPEWTQTFEKGWIVDGPKTTPQALWGDAHTVWRRTGFGKGLLGHPSGPRTPRRDGGWVQPFRNGCVADGPRTPAAAVAGRVFLAWDKAGGLDGRYGYPLSDVVRLPDGSWKGEFEGGTITTS